MAARTPRSLSLLGVVLAVGALSASAQAGEAPKAAAGPAPGQHAQTLRTDAGEVRYLLYIPEGYAESAKPWPLVLFLHGAGERGEDLEKVKKHGPPKLIARGKRFPFLCVSPQCPQGDWWSSPKQVARLTALLDHLEKTLRVDPDRVYVTGLSMGGFGTWALAVAQPKRFAAIAPICGKGDPSKADRIAHLPVWVFHGGKDRVVPVRHSEEMVEALKRAGGKPKLTIYPDAGHDSWTRTYENPEFWRWLLAQRRKK